MKFDRGIVFFALCLGVFELGKPAWATQEKAAQCLKRDWTQSSCKVLETTDYQQSLIDRIVMDATVHLINSGAELASRAVLSKKTKGDQILDLFGQELRDLSLRQGLSECQTLCASLCMSSGLIDFENGKVPRYMPISFAVENGKGECNEYARIAQRLLTDANIESETANSLSMGHSYLKVRLDGQAFYAEPMNDQCVIYRAQ